MSDPTMFRPLLSILVLFYIFLISACSDSRDNNTRDDSRNTNEALLSSQSEQTEPSSSIELDPTRSLFINTVDEHFSELLNESKYLHENLMAFTKKPTQESLQKTIQHLEKTHALFISGYFLDTCCLIYTPPQVQDENVTNSIKIKTRLDQQPLLPGYLDAVEGYPFSGLIYADIPITVENMAQEFQLGDTAYVSLGFHALELILKGSNLKRKVSDFSTLTSTSDTSSAPPELRRTLYAMLLASEIKKDISALKQAWEANLKKQLQQSTSAQAEAFFDALNVKIEKEIQDQKNQDDHFNLESISLKQTLLDKLASLKALNQATKLSR
tara:strand:- start:10914 stop:11894 length:981 start_codon:yes stop_codon:yes gene_type:complete